ncbi:LysR family transcriptional regulator [Streptomyces qinglanensis]|uniref:DNA-binding transcriptional regulator, LysR family n=1 Tax=Streptomyces qinglanensis TaxID=943816 RepID=A0A1H9WFF4_9ACTN|nr:LysR family transcriptional regulator [Streptomyces qinglanensis]SES32662.1 DNA-binding transcriptional regulator, LysR family [Streptomyces qinglanensis]
MTTLRQLEYFVAIVDEGSFTAAAALLDVTQPGLSHQFLALEKEVGGRLLERLPRGVRLTPAGRAMLPSARAALADVRRCVTAARRATGVASGELQIAALYSVSSGILPTALSRWRALHPEVRITLFEHRQASEMAAAMAAGQADVAIGPPPPGWEGIVRHLGEEEFVVVAGADDPAAPASGSTVRLADLARRDWVHFTHASGLADTLEEACGAAGFRPSVAVRTEQGPSAVNFAAAGLGPTLVPGNVVPRHFPGVVLRPEPPFRRSVAAYTRTGADPIAGAFLDVLSDVPLTPTHVRRRLGDSS